MATFQEMQNDLQLMGMANLVQTDIGTLLNKVNREEVEAHDWSFLYTNLIVWGVPPISGSTMVLTPGSNVVSDPNAIFTPDMAGWFLSVGATLTTPIIVNAFLDAQDLQLDTPWQGAASSAIPYTIFPLYYDLYPIVTPIRIRQIDTLVQTSQAYLAQIDPSRISTGGNPSYRWAQGPWTNDSPRHYTIELWPRATAALPYIVDGKLGVSPMINPNDAPQLPSTVIEAKACMYLCRAAFASNGNPKWFQLAEGYRQDYQAELDKAIIEDNRRKVTLGVNADGTGRGVNLGLDYYSVHDGFGPPDYNY